MPIKLKPEATIGDVEIVCCDQPCVICNNACCDCETSQIIIQQNVCLRIPVAYRITAVSGDGTVKCNNQSGYSEK